MGLDIYAGTLIRYYTDNWKTVTQQFAQANGMNFETIRPQSDLNQELMKRILSMKTKKQ